MSKEKYDTIMNQINKKLWLQSETVCGSEMIDIELASSIISEELLMEVEEDCQ